MNHVEVGAQCEHALLSNGRFTIGRFFIAVGFQPGLGEGGTVPDASAEVDAGGVTDVVCGKAHVPVGEAFCGEARAL